MWFHKKTSDQSQYTVVCRSLLRKDSISSSTILEQEASWLFVKREWKQANLHPHQRHPRADLGTHQRLALSYSSLYTASRFSQGMQISLLHKLFNVHIQNNVQLEWFLLTIYSHGVRGRPNGAHLGSLRLKYLRAILSQKEIICMLSWNKKCPLWDRKGSSVR